MSCVGKIPVDVPGDGFGPLFTDVLADPPPDVASVGVVELTGSLDEAALDETPVPLPAVEPLPTAADALTPDVGGATMLPPALSGVLEV